jgi:HK97 family phage portal protein
MLAHFFILMAKKKTIITRLLDAFGYAKKSGVAVSGLGYYHIPATPHRKTGDYLASYTSWVYACVRARAQDVSRIKLRLYRRISEDEAEEVKDHNVLSLLRGVNEFMTQQELFEYTQSYKDLAGEAFWYLMRAGDRPNSDIIQIWVLRPDWVTIATDPENHLSGYVYRIPGVKDMPISREDIVHFKEFNPVDAYRGLSVLSAAALTIDADNFAESFNRNFFENSATPSIVLESEETFSDDQIKRLRADWFAEYGGKDKAHKMAILHGGLKAHPFVLSQRDMEYLEGQKFSRDKILALFKTPKTVLGMTEDVTVSNAEATDYVFSKRTVKPLMEKIRNTLNEFLLPKYKDGDKLFFDFDDPTPQDQAAKIEKYKGMFAIGAMTPNEIRAAEGLDEAVGLDNFYVPVGMMPLMEEGNPEIDEDAKRITHPVSKKPKVDVPPPTLRNKIAENIAKGVKYELMNALAQYSAGTKQKEAIPQSRLSEDQKVQMWKSLIQKTDRWEDRYKVELHKIFARQEKETIARLNATQKALNPGDIDSVLFEVSKEVGLSVNVLMPILRQLAQDIGDDSLDSVGADENVFNTTTEQMRYFFRVDAVRGIRLMNRVTRRELRKVLADGVKDGLGIPDIARNIKKVFADADTARATKIARTEVLKAANYTAVEAYKQSGVVVGKQWFTAEDERVCPICAPLNGNVIALSETFFDINQTQVGSDGNQYKITFENIGAPPRHPNCRCTMVPITKFDNPK